MEEKKFDKAEEIIDLSLEKMPVNKFGHYSMLIGYVDLYYGLNKKEKARKLTAELKTVLQENLRYYSQFDESNVEAVYNDIERSLLMYDQLIKTAIRFDDEKYANSLKEEYVGYLKLFDFLISDEDK